MKTLPRTNLQSQLTGNAPLVVLILLLTDSLHFVFAGLFRPYLPPVLAALYALGIATVEVAIYMGVTGRIQWRLLRRNLPFFLAIGFLVALATSLSYTSVTFLDPGTAAMLAQTSTIFALALGFFWLRERLTLPLLGGAALAITGVFIISFQPGDYLRWGSLIVLGSAFAYSLHAAIVKRYGGEMPFANFFLFRIGSTTLFLLFFAGARQELAWPPAQAWPILVLAGSIDVVLSRTLYYLALRRLQMSFHAILLTLSPVITILWSLLLFGERPSAQGFWGGTAVIAGVILVTWSRQLRRKRGVAAGN